MTTASDEKERLEVKQRKVRHYMEKNNLEHKPKYFEEVAIEEDTSQLYWKYNHLYFEKDRKN